jgi:glycosyltransferase involved in cell wall biosynthesis
MTIVFITPSSEPAIGGVERHLSSIIPLLERRGHIVHLFTPSLPEQYSGQERRYALDPSRQVIRQWFRLWRHRHILLDADVVHCHDYGAFLWYLPFRFLWWRKPTYITFHGWEGRFPPDLQTIWLRRLAERLADGSIAVGAFIGRWYGQRPDFVTYGGVTPFECENTRRARRAVFVGGLREDTGIRTYLAAAMPLLRSGELEVLDIVGDGPLLPELTELVAPLRARVCFHGFRADVSQFLCRARIACVSSYLAMLESLQAGAAVIATYEHALKRDYLLDSPFAEHIDACETPSKVRSAMRRALAKQGSRYRRDRAREFALTQTWERVAEVYEALWRK